MKQVVRLNESELKSLIRQTVKTVLDESVAEAKTNGGNEINFTNADMAYKLAVEKLGGQARVDRMIIQYMPKDALAETLAGIFRMQNLDIWDEYCNAQEAESENWPQKEVETYDEPGRSEYIQEMVTRAIRKVLK